MRNPSKNTLKRIIKLLGDNPKKELPYRERKATRHGRFILHNGKITFKLGNLNYGVPNYEFLFGKLLASSNLRAKLTFTPKTAT